MSEFIPVNIPYLGEAEKAKLLTCIETGWISSEGPFVEAFEQAFAQKVNRTHGVAVCNGTAALYVAIKALSLPKGSEIILPSFCIISCLQAVLDNGYKPVLVDCCEKTWNMQCEQIESKINHNTGAILMVHTYGLPVDVDPILALAKKYDLKIIEDAAEAIGLDYKHQPCGQFGDISIVSFYPNKTITTGEGGMVLTNDDTLAQRARALRNLCFGEKRFVHEALGWNFRMTNLQAAVGVAQLERFEQHVEKKRAIGLAYDQAFTGLAKVQLPLAETPYAKNGYWVYGLVLEEAISRDEVVQALAKLGVGTRPFFWPMHQQPVLLEQGLFADEHYPISERIARQGFYVPSGLGLTSDMQAQVIEAVKTLIKKYDS